MNGRTIAEDLCARGKPVHLSAVYRALARLHANRTVKRVELCDGYILPRDAIVAEALCDRCGLLIAVPVDAPIAELARHAHRLGFNPDRYVIELTGQCHSCTVEIDVSAVIPSRPLHCRAGRNP